jgi:hypothetical protein
MSAHQLGRLEAQQFRGGYEVSAVVVDVEHHVRANRLLVGDLRGKFRQSCTQPGHRKPARADQHGPRGRDDLEDVGFAAGGRGKAKHRGWVVRLDQ